ncbi:Receptor-like protein [Arachis hypogaea]|nr:Receptor-like protein [Arachis hypogaea]
MMRCFTLLLLLLLLLDTPSSTYSSVLPLCNHHDNSNLLQFKNSFSINPPLYNDWWWSAEMGIYCSSYPKIASWKNGTDCCEWDGVTCDTTSGHVIGLDLSCSMLEGEFHPNSTLFHVTHLQQLNLAFNNFSNSPIYPGIGNLMSLTHLNLSHSSFSSHIPSTISHLSKLLSLHLSYNYELTLDESTWSKLIGNTTNLEELVLDGVDMSSIRETSLSLLMNFSSSLLILSLYETGLHGKFPTRILGFPNLEELTLNDNEELKGELPESNWSSPLTILDLSNTAFSGEIPDSIGHLKSLNQLRLEYCQFDGLNPVSLWNLTQLTHLDLSGNRLHGEIPSLLSNLKHLTYLDLSDNTFSGHIPDSMNFIDLSFNQLQGDLPIPPNGTYYFAVSNNNFTGGIPSTLSLSTELILSHNHLSGTIPSMFCNATFLDALILSHNHLSGVIPQCLGALPDLTILDLQVNNLHGNIPTHFSQNYNFQTIKLNNNQLDGSLPRSLSNCIILEVLDLAENNIEDVFPSWLEGLQELQVLSLKANKFHGTITSFGAKHPFPKLRIFDVSNNKFSGPLSTSFFESFQGMKDLSNSTHHPRGLLYMHRSSGTAYNDSVVVIIKGQSTELVRILTTFTTIDLSNNMFEGEIPHVIGELSSLKGLNLSHNKISGTIPKTLENLTSLEWLDLSWNQLKGEIPMALTNLNFLAVLNLSENQLKGIIPIGEQFNTFQNNSYIGNPMLCGFPLSKSCDNDKEQPPSVFAEAKESLFGWKAVAVGYGCGVVFGMFLGRLFIKTAKPLWLARLLCGYT